MTNYNRHQEVARGQAKQIELNTAKLLAYVTGCYDGGWLVECDGHIDGFSIDYMFVHSNPGNIDCHKVTTVWLAGGEETDFPSELKEVLDACAAENDGIVPNVVTITDEDIAAHKKSLAGFYADYVAGEENCDLRPDSAEAWLAALLGSESLDETTPDTAKLAEEIANLERNN